MLQRALISFMLDVHISKHGCTELRPPFIVRPEVPLGTGQLPKFGDQMYHVYDASVGAEQCSAQSVENAILKRAEHCSAPTEANASSARKCTSG